MSHAGPPPIYQPNRSRLGLFAVNCDGGMVMSQAPEVIREWSATVAPSQLQAGLRGS